MDTGRGVGVATVLAVSALTAGSPSSADGQAPIPVEWHSLETGAGTLRAAVLGPRPGVADGPAPVVLALPGGYGTTDLVLGSLERFWADEPARRGWWVVALEGDASRYETTAPDVVAAVFEWMDAVGTEAGGEMGRAELDGREMGVAEMDGRDMSGAEMDGRDMDRWRMDTDRVVLAGVSNGGLGMFWLASAAPDRFLGLLGLPGRFMGTLTEAAALRGLPIHLVVGEDDGSWREGARATQAVFDQVGGDVRVTVLPGRGHGLGVAPAEVMDWVEDLERRRP